MTVAAAPVTSTAARHGYPARICCLTEETTEILYSIGAGDLVVGVSGYTVRPPEARRKPKVSAFTSARIDRILAIRPDVVFAFSDLQADITRELIRQGLSVFTFNQRSISEILSTIRVVGSIVGYHGAADALAARLAGRVDQARERALRLPRHPRVYFEEWDDPMISGIRWVAELVEAAGGEDIFPELKSEPIASGRIVSPDEIVRRNPEVIIGSWCGRKFRPETVAARPGFNRVAAVQNGCLCEVKSTIILQPGPAALTDGLEALERIITAACH